MAWNYTEPQRRRRPLDTPVRPAGTGGTGGPPTGAAGGDLTGTYPNPTVAPGAVAWGEIAGAPTTLPPSGPAGGDLVGTYPNPDIKALAVGTPELAAGAVTDAKVTDVAWAKITGAPASFPPSGAASGDLSGAYPAPQLAAGVIVDADVSASAAIQYTKLAGVPTALPPSGAASGDLTGTYPGPTVAAAKITAAKLSPAPVAGDVGKMVTVATGPALAYTAVPTALPPSGTAGGDLSGSYPNPDIAAGVIVNADVNAAAAIQGTKLADAPNGVPTAKLNDLAVTDAKIAGVAYSKVTGTPTALPPSGTAGGDLSGSYPNPQLGAGVIVDADVSATAAIQYTKLTGVPTSLPGPPTGAASGDLTGTYPGPTLAKLNGATVGTTTPLARGDLLVANATPALTRLALGGASQVLQSNGTDVVWGASLGGPPSGAASGSLAGTYPGPSIAASAVRGTPSSGGTAREIAKASIWGGDDLIDLSVPTAKLAALAVTDAKVNDVAATKLTGTIAQARFPVAPSGLLTANLNDAQITAAKLATNSVGLAQIQNGAVDTNKIASGGVTSFNILQGATVRTFAVANLPVSTICSTNAWTVVGTVSITTTGGGVLLWVNSSIYANTAASNRFWMALTRDGVVGTGTVVGLQSWYIGGSAAAQNYPVPGMLVYDTPSVAAHTYRISVQPQGGATAGTSPDNTGIIAALELS